MNKVGLALAISIIVSVFNIAKADDEAQTEMRLNPEIEESQNKARESYPFLKLDANRIEMNGDDWSDLAARFAAARDSDHTFSLVYLGDSHIQADFGGAVLRSRMTNAAGSAGRGLIIPFKLAGTNQPADYGVHLHSAFPFLHL